MTEQCSKHMLQAHAPRNALYGRTDGRTNEEGLSPTRDIQTFVTRTPAYGFSPDLIRARAKLILETLTPTNPVTILDALPADTDAARHWAELAGDLCTVTGCNAVAEDGWCLAHYPDDVAIQRAMKGERLTLLAHERDEVIRRLGRQGLTSAQISERAHVNRKAIIRVLALCRDLGLPSNVAPVPVRSTTERNTA